MKSTNTMPKRVERGVCTRCRTELPAPLLREEGESLVCRNAVACRKRRAQFEATKATTAAVSARAKK